MVKPTRAWPLPTDATGRECACGSGRQRREQRDARGIFLTFTCADCHTRRMAGFRSAVLTDPAYEADEPIDED